MTNEEIRATFLGQAVREYDGWNGSKEEFVVRDMCIGEDYVNLFGQVGGKGDGGWKVPGVSLDKSIVEQLILTGKYVSHHEIDHCPYDVTIQLLPTEQQKFERRIEDIKTNIKRLKQELKQEQTDYQNFLVSSVRLEVIRNNNELNK